MKGDKITIFSMNIQGAHGSQKRRDVINYVRNKQYSIVCLIDTHFTKNKEHLIASEWGYRAVFNSFNSQCRGVAIFFNNNFEYKLHNTFRDHNGNCLLLDIEIEKRRITLAVIYGPNKDEPHFYDKLQRDLIKMGNKNIIVTGDFNLLLNPLIDGKNYKHINNPNARQNVLKMMAELDLYDVWREENVDKNIYTWRRKLQSGEIQMGRLDFFLVSGDLITYTKEEKIISGYRTDHSAIQISLIFNPIIKPKTFWKFNNSLLHNIKFITEIKNVINDVKKQYAATPYNLLNINLVENEHFQTTINPQLFFEILLLEIRSKTIAFSSALKKQENRETKELEVEINNLEKSDPTGNYEEVKIKQEKLRLIREQKLKGTIIRSRARWIDQGEKPSKYFCNLESRHFVSKRMTSIIGPNQEEITDFNLIKENVNKFYKNLYSSKEILIENVNLNDRLNNNTPKLNDHEAENIEGLITLDEAAQVLSRMKNNKSPGTSGFTVEFFKYFWRDIGFFLVNSINYGFSIKEMSSTQKEGIITCIPKGNKCKKYIKNWRPISLLNVSYKIASGCIARRIKSVLPSIINLDQSGFMAGRGISDNIRLLYDTLYFGREEKKTGLLLLIDFEKAFDSVAWSFIKKVFIFFNFKPNIIRWIESFYKNIKSTVIVNSTTTPWFPIERGCRQGDPISPYIFLICSEILAHMVRQSDKIKSYSIYGEQILISQFADDTSLFLDGSKESFHYCIETILEYAKYSGLSMNFDKTKVVWFGCEQKPETVFLPELNFEWNPQTFNVLGVEFTTDLQNITDINLNKSLLSITNDLNQWAKRDLTPFGKVVVIKTQIISKFVHLLISLPSPSKKMITEINKLLFNFLWNDKPDKIKRTVAKQHLTKGGLGMIDLNIFNKSLKLTWIRKFFESSASWRQLISKKIPSLDSVMKFGDAFIEQLLNEINNPFWKNVFSDYITFYRQYKFKTLEELEATSLLANNKIKIGNKVITNKQLAEKSLFQIKQLKNCDRYLSLQQLNTKFGTNLNFLQYHSILKAVEKFILPFKHLQKGREIQYQPHLNIIMSTKKGSSTIYRELLEEENEITGYKKCQLS